MITVPVTAEDHEAAKRMAWEFHYNPANHGGRLPKDNQNPNIERFCASKTEKVYRQILGRLGEIACGRVFNARVHTDMRNDVAGGRDFENWDCNVKTSPWPPVGNVPRLYFEYGPECGFRTRIAVQCAVERRHHKFGLPAAIVIVGWMDRPGFDRIATPHDFKRGAGDQLVVERGALRDIHELLRRKVG